MPHFMIVYCLLNLSWMIKCLFFFFFFFFFFFEEYGAFNGMDSFSRKATAEIDFVFKKGSTLKGKNLLLTGANSFLLE